MRKLIVTSIFVTALSVVSQAVVLDQIQHSNTVYMAGFAQDDLAQSFKQSNNIISGAGFFLKEGVGVGEFGDITIALYDNLPNQSGNLIVQGTVTGLTENMWADVLWGDVNITAGQTYYLVATSSNINLGIAGDTNNPYADGQVYANSGFGSFPDFDYTFHTYTAVPEPTTMVALGLGAAALLRRRRKA